MTELRDLRANAEASPAVPPATMADLIERIRNDTALTPTRRRDVCSAIRTICRLLHTQPDSMSARASLLRRRLEGFHPKQAGLSGKRYRNIRADLSFALKRYVPAVPLRIDSMDLPPSWQGLQSRLTAETLRYGLSRFIMYCALNAIEPEDVCDDTVVRFREWLEDFTLVKEPARRARTTISLWNKACGAVPGWPAHRLTVEPAREAYCVDWDDVSSSLRREVEDWLNLLAGKDPLAEGAPLRPLRPDSLKACRFRVRQAISALVQRGYPLESILSLSVLTDLEQVRVILRFFLERSGGNPTSQTAGIAACLVSIARHWVKVDEHHLAELVRLKAKVTPRQQGLTQKNRDRLRQFDSDRNKALLLAFPQTIARRLARNNRLTRKDALLLQTAVAVEILTMAPLRLRNLATLQPERHLVRYSDHRRERVHLVIPGVEVKNGQDLEFELPVESARLLGLYKDRARPLLGTDATWLFPGAKVGCHKAPEQLSRQIKKMVFAETGLVVNVHLFRHISAKLYLDENAGGYETVRRVLQHRSIDTTTAHYTGFETMAAARHYDDIILDLRRRYEADDG